VEQANQTTGVADSLLVPNNLLVWTVALVFWPIFVFLDAKLLVCLAHREYEEEGMGGSRYESKEFRVVDAEDVVKGKLVRQAELVNKSRHDLWVVLCCVLLDVCYASRGALPRGMNLFLPLGTSGEVSDAMLLRVRMVLRGRRSE
jgi:hypothetical protein